MNRIPKNLFVGADVLQLGVYDAVAHFNIGIQAAVNIFKEMKLHLRVSRPSLYPLSYRVNRDWCTKYFRDDLTLVLVR